eukprot:4122244-Pleurochrysis_carterae.AAC.2
MASKSWDATLLAWIRTAGRNRRKEKGACRVGDGQSGGEGAQAGESERPVFSLETAHVCRLQVYPELANHLVETLLCQAHVYPLPVTEAAVYWCEGTRRG